MIRIGIDIGGTQSRVAAIQENTVIKQAKIMTDSENPIKHIEKLIQLINEFDVEYESIGVSCPGPLDLHGGKILNPPNLPGWHDFALTSYLEKVTGKKVRLDNDANCAALAEAVIGSGKGYNCVPFVTISTGIGAGLVLNQELFYGANGFALEVANCLVDETNSVDGSTLQGSVERICSGTGIYRQAWMNGLNVENTADVFKLANEGNQQAAALLDYVSDKLANFLAMLQAVLDPDLIVIGGSVALHNPEFVQNLEQKVRMRMYENVRPYVHLSLAQLGDDAGILGATLLNG